MNMAAVARARADHMPRATAYILQMDRDDRRADRQGPRLCRDGHVLFAVEKL